MSKFASLGRWVSSLAGLSLLVGFLCVSPVYGLIKFPGVRKLQNSVDKILDIQRQDILRQGKLITTQNAINRNIGILNQKLGNTTNPDEIARLEQQLTIKQSQFRSFQVSIDRNTVLLRRDLDVLKPQKDQALQRLIGLRRPHPVNQIRLFVAAALQREREYEDIIKRFLQRRPISPTTPF